MYCDFCFGSSNDIYQVCSRCLIELSFPRARLVCSFPCVRALILKEYENLHVYFDDCVARRVTNASGAFLELAPSAGSSSDAFHVNIQQNLCCTVMFFQLYPFPTPGIPYFARLN